MVVSELVWHYTVYGRVTVVMGCISNSTMKSVSGAVIALDNSLWLTSSIAILVDWFIDLVLEI